ncbi:hypothetical protein SPI_04392 [Niveomyces insectorum RCEF 264]|uniref:Uncharacterized protein n=1 Tax=Niveomyces insectorum RCEF 264 TaxID=1081102 RepID=A0A162J2G2_9HYPO|nr:hypothetical protein SPI_04392 [Niveomyces insectorum RCEF 264]
MLPAMMKKYGEITGRLRDPGVVQETHSGESESETSSLFETPTGSPHMSHEANQEENGGGPPTPTVAVFMTAAEEKEWRRFCEMRAAARAQGHNYLQPLRRAFAEMALVTKRLELRCNVNGAFALQRSIKQQGMLEEDLWFGQHGEIDTIYERPEDELAATYDDARILVDRLQRLEHEVAQGIATFGHDVMDLGQTIRAKADTSRTDPYRWPAHGVEPTDELTLVDVAKGYTVLGYAGRLMEGELLENRRHGLEGFEHVRLDQLNQTVWTHCEPIIQRALGGPSVLEDENRKTLFENWLSVSQTRVFTDAIQAIMSLLQEDAALRLKEKKQKAETAAALGQLRRNDTYVKASPKSPISG